MLVYKTQNSFLAIDFHLITILIQIYKAFLTNLKGWKCIQVDGNVTLFIEYTVFDLTDWFKFMKSDGSVN